MLPVQYFFSMSPNESPQYAGIIWLLQHFGWTWVGLFVIDDDSGEYFLQVLEPLLSQNGICSAFTQLIPKQIQLLQPPDYNHMLFYISLPFYTKNETNVFLVYGETQSMMWLTSFMVEAGLCDKELPASYGKVWLMMAQIDFALNTLQKGLHLQMFHGAISFAIHSGERLGFEKFLRLIKPGWAQRDGFLKIFWEQAFQCSFPEDSTSVKEHDACTGEERLESLPGPFFEMRMTGHSYSIYNAVYAVAHALHARYTSRASQRTKAYGKILEDLQPWQVMSSP